MSTTEELIQIINENLPDNSATRMVKLRGVLEEIVKGLEGGGGGGGGGGTPIFQGEVTVALSGNKTVGKYLNGQKIILEGKTFEEILSDIAIETMNPTFIEPSYTLTSSITGNVEVGTEVTVELVGDFNRGAINGKLVGGVWDPNTKQANRAGAPTEYKFNGITQQTTNSKIITGYKTVLGNNDFQSQVLYSAGPQPTDSNEDNFGIPLPAGEITAHAYYTGSLMRFFGAGDEVVDPRTLIMLFDTTPISQTFDINTGTTERYFHLYIPDDKVLEKVELVEASYADITTEYVLQGDEQVPDPSGDLHNCKYYKMEGAVPYGISVTHRIKIKNA